MSNQLQTRSLSVNGQTTVNQTAPVVWPSGMIGTEKKTTKKQPLFKEGYHGLLGGAEINKPWKSKRRGLGLAEMMIALVISALLLTATAAALDSSFKAYTANQEQSSLMQQSRIAMNRMITTIRLSETHGPYNSTPLASFSIGSTVTDHGISMYDQDDNLVTYRYDSTNKLLYCATEDAERVMLEGVEQFDVVMEPMRSAASIKTAGAYDLLRRAIITLSVKTTENTAGVGESTGNQVVTLSAAVAPRRNAW